MRKKTTDCHSLNDIIGKNKYTLPYSAFEPPPNSTSETVPEDLVNDVFGDMLNCLIFVYLDSNLIFFGNIEEHEHV